MLIFVNCLQNPDNSFRDNVIKNCRSQNTIKRYDLPASIIIYFFFHKAFPDMVDRLRVLNKAFFQFCIPVSADQMAFEIRILK